MLLLRRQSWAAGMELFMSFWILLSDLSLRDIFPAEAQDPSAAVDLSGSRGTELVTFDAGVCDLTASASVARDRS